MFQRNLSCPDGISFMNDKKLTREDEIRWRTVCKIWEESYDESLHKDSKPKSLQDCFQCTYVDEKFEINLFNSDLDIGAKMEEQNLRIALINSIVMRFISNFDISFYSRVLLKSKKRGV